MGGLARPTPRIAACGDGAKLVWMGVIWLEWKAQARASMHARMTAPQTAIDDREYSAVGFGGRKSAQSAPTRRWLGQGENEQENSRVQTSGTRAMTVTR